MDQCRGLQRMPWRLACHAGRSEAAQRIIDQRQQLFRCLLVTISNRFEDLGYLLRRLAHTIFQTALQGCSQNRGSKNPWGATTLNSKTVQLAKFFPETENQWCVVICEWGAV